MITGNFKNIFPEIKKFFYYKSYKYNKTDFCTLMKDLKSDLGKYDDICIEFAKQIKNDFKSTDFLVYIPKSVNNSYEFNYSRRTAEILSDILNIPVKNDIIFKIKETMKLRTLNYNNRTEEISGAFKINPNTDKNSKICIVDDVLVSGTTLKEVTKSFSEAGITDLSAAILINHDYLSVNND